MSLLNDIQLHETSPNGVKYQYDYISYFMINEFNDIM